MKKLTVDNFAGGISEGSKRGYVGSFNDGIGVDFRTDPDRLSVLPKLKLARTPSGLMHYGKAVGSTYAWFTGSGYLYRLRRDGTESSTPDNYYNYEWSVAGLGMDYFKSSLFVGLSTSITKIDDLDTTVTKSGSTVLTQPKFTTGFIKSLDSSVAQHTGITGTNTYTTKTTIGETSVDKRNLYNGTTFYTITAIAIRIDTKGTGTLTLTVHDASNAVLQTKTINNATIPASGEQYRFVLDQPIDAKTTSTQCHFHVTSSVADTKLSCVTTNDLSTVSFSQNQAYLDTDRDQSNDISTTAATIPNVYTVPTKIPGAVIASELTVDKCTFIPTKSTIGAISLFVSWYETKSASSLLYVDLHDSNNKVIGTFSYALPEEKALPFYGYLRLTPSSEIKVTVGETYHFHAYTNDLNIYTATIYLMTSVNADLSTASYIEHFAVLDSSSYHPMKVFTNKLCIGNGNKLAIMDDSYVYDPEAIVFPEGEIVRCLEVIGDRLAISTMRGSELYTYGESRIYFWDGTSTTYNEFVDIDGQVNAMKTNKNLLYIIHGTQNTISIYSGAITLLRRIKFVGQTQTVYTHRGSMDVWENLIIWGLQGGTSPIDHAVYTLGKKNKDYALALNKSFRISTKNMGLTVQIGSILSISSTELYVCWQDNTTGSAVYGIDALDITSYEQEAYVSLLRFDGKRPNMEKVGKSVSMRTAPLLNGQAVEIWYKINTNGDFQYLGELNGMARPNEFYRSFALEQRFFEIEFKFYLKTITTTAPTILAFEFNYDEKYEYQLDARQSE